MSESQKGFGGTIVGVAVGVVVGGLLAGAVMFGCDDPAPKALDGGAVIRADVDGEEVDPQPTEAEVATTFVEHGGKRLRVSGVGGAPGDQVEDTALGRGVVKDSAAVNVAELECHVVLEAPARPAKQENEEGRAWKERQPVMPGLEKHLGVAAWPVEIGGSCTPGPAGLCFWSAMFKGQACLDILDSPYYACSSVPECIALPLPKRKRLLRAEGTCTDADGTHPCTVPFGDKDMNANARVFIPHSWAGRNDLNFVKGTTFDGSAFDVPARYKVPTAEARAEPVEIHQ